MRSDGEEERALVAEGPLRSLTEVVSWLGTLQPDSQHLVLPRGLSFGAWEGVVGLLRYVERGAQWWLGDALVYGEGSFGERYAQAIGPGAASEAQARTCLWVAERVAPERRCVGLSWQHHRIVASSEPAEQEYWLRRALEERWTTRELQHALREARHEHVLDARTAVLSPLPALIGRIQATCPQCGYVWEAAGDDADSDT